MGLFITVKISDRSCAEGCKACVDSCPVEIFTLHGKRCVIVPENEDECTLCEICLQRCPKNCIELVRNY